MIGWMKVLKVLNPDFNVSHNVENHIIPVRSMISNVGKVEKYPPLNCGHTRLIQINVYCYNFPNT